jgi:hypothetical protein
MRFVYQKVGFQQSSCPNGYIYRNLIQRWKDATIHLFFRTSSTMSFTPASHLVIQLTDSVSDSHHQYPWEKELPAHGLSTLWDTFEVAPLPEGEQVIEERVADIFDLYPIHDNRMAGYSDQIFESADDFYLSNYGGGERAKQCSTRSCDKRAQTLGKCKSHGGGARCSVHNCMKSSQGGGFCRGHGGGSRCKVDGCNKGTQRHGLCFIHGGVRLCSVEGCEKKDRGNGRCISHGGGKRCEVEGCSRSVRKGNHCQAHITSLSGGSQRPLKRGRYSI